MKWLMMKAVWKFKTIISFALMDKEQRDEFMKRIEEEKKLFKFGATSYGPHGFPTDWEYDQPEEEK
ncbi:MAG: hypothetical protein ACNI26_12970 [Terasakiella sp.]|uniref:hypothetical protein n=1 Tax=unclassified Terasakiella TaxID=2614952 RepID=UPI003AFFC6F1